MVRVAIFTDNDFDKVNGVTTTLKAILRHRGPFEPRIYMAADFGVDTADCFAAGSLGMGLPLYSEMRVYVPRLRQFARELRRVGTDVVHVTTPGPVGLAGRWLARRLGLPLVGSYHTQLGDYARELSGSPRLGALVEHLTRWCYQPCEPLLVPSQTTRALLAARGYPLERIQLWGRGVDTDGFTPARAAWRLRESWHVDARRPAILYAGRLSREKGLALMKPVQRLLRRHGLDHRLVFVGDGPMRSELQQLCPDAVFLGSVPHAEVAAAMASADVFVFPSATDTLGNVVLEAQASGLPVVVSDRGGPHEHVLGGITGFVCTANDPDSFGRALVALLRQPALRAEMGRQARAHALTQDWPSSLAPLFGAWRHAALRRPIKSRDRLRHPTSTSPVSEELTK
jgi:glycosyltransferase involved in cell wall biosynthesis